MDTQLPRYEVFDQFKPATPHQHAGSVHAADPEMALLNARDVYARRPPHTNMWVVRADRIFSRTREELQKSPFTAAPLPAQAGDALIPFVIFEKRSHKNPAHFAREVMAPSPESALAAALGTKNAGHVLVWWVVAAAEVWRSDAEDPEAFFRPAEDKPYRHQSFYHVVTLMRRLRERSIKSNRAGGLEEPDES